MRYVAILEPEFPPRVAELLRDPTPDAVWARKVSLSAKRTKATGRYEEGPSRFGDLEIETDEAIT